MPTPRFAVSARFALLTLCAALSVAFAAPAQRLALVPLDSRPVTRLLPVKIGQLTGARVSTPDVTLLGTAERGANQAGLRAWIRGQGGYALPETAGAAPTVSAARPAPIARPTRAGRVRARTARFRPRRAVFRPHTRPKSVPPSLPSPGTPRPGIGSAPWVADALVVSLDALAYGGLVQSRSNPLPAEEAVRNLSVVREWREKTGKPVYASITLPRAKDARYRERNYAVILEMLRWAREGVFEELRVTWDDAHEGSPALAEAAALQAIAPAKVLMYPGADEVLASLAVRAVAPAPKTLRVVYADPDAARDTAHYDGVPLQGTVAAHARANGFTLTPGDADLTLFVYNGGDPVAAARDIARLAARPLAVADLLQVNTAFAPLWQHLRQENVVPRLRALGAWGTPGNNVGSALSHAKMTLEADLDRDAARDLLAYEYANDVLFSSKVRAQLQREFRPDELSSARAQRRLYDIARDEVQPHFPEGTYEVTRSRLPWGRAFEWEAELTFYPDEHDKP